ncbi:MAG TPA: hypothetical protein VFB25_08950 [Gaiellaceae bacterium]|nr:hypothetical protein [Gaiellaceae bacterium]
MSSLDPTQLPPLDSTLVPAAVKQGGQKAEQLYNTALQFEQLLVQQLTQQIDFTGDDSSSDDGSDDGSDSTTQIVGQMLPEALAQGITNGGGLGLASNLYDSLALPQGLPTIEGQ